MVYPNCAATREAIRRDLCPAIAFAGGRVEDVADFLFPIEEQAVISAVTKRRKEFVAGRAYARRALEALGRAQSAIPVDSDRVPIWPTGIVGSISHCSDFCGSIAACSKAFVSLGFDVEPDDPIEDHVIAIICSSLDLIATSKLGMHAPKLVFCIKESVYKAYFPLARTFLDFSDLVIEAASDGHFTARLTRDGIPPAAGIRTFTGRFIHAGGILAAWTMIKA